MNINLTQDEWCVSDNIIYISVNTYILTYPIITTNIKLGSSIHPEHLINHENSNIVIRDIWEKHTDLLAPLTDLVAECGMTKKKRKAKGNKSHSSQGW